MFHNGYSVGAHLQDLPISGDSRVSSWMIFPSADCRTRIFEALRPSGVASRSYTPSTAKNGCHVQQRMAQPAPRVYHAWAWDWWLNMHPTPAEAVLLYVLLNISGLAADQVSRGAAHVWQLVWPSSSMQLHAHVCICMVVQKLCRGERRDRERRTNESTAPLSYCSWAWHWPSLHVLPEKHFI